MRLEAKKAERGCRVSAIIRINRPLMWALLPDNLGRGN